MKEMSSFSFHNHFTIILIHLATPRAAQGLETDVAKGKKRSARGAGDATWKSAGKAQQFGMDDAKESMHL